MRVNIFLMDPEQPFFKGKQLASVELEVVPRGFYIIDEVEYQFAGQPTFHIKKQVVFPTDPTHVLKSVDLLVIPVST